jgi:hypothetical protein
VLSGLTVCAMLTAVIAGITGAWSPCGFSMVDTIGTALGDVRRAATAMASATFALGAVIGGAITFGGLALVGHLLDPGAGGLREGVGAVIALAAAIADWRGVKIVPQIRRQVPERWRWTMPLPLACGLYGILLGLGFTTFVLTFAVWALAGISFAAGDPGLGVLVGCAFGVGRALPVLWMAPGLRGGEGAQRLDRMAAEPRMWLGLRRLDAIGLSLCALFLSGASATAAGLPHATDPSTAGGQLAWQQVGGLGLLRAQSGHTSVLPGRYPALGGSMIAWATPGQVTVANVASMTTSATIPVAQLNALAVSDSWLVYRDQSAEGDETLVGVPLSDPSQRRYIAGTKIAGELGRPALDGSEVVFTYDTPRRNAIELVNLASGAHRVLRASHRNVALVNASIFNGRLLYEHVDRCSQQLRIGPLGSSGRDRVLLSLPSTVQRDPGYQRGYEHAYNSASLCPTRANRRGGRAQLGATALGASAAYVTEVPANAGEAHIIRVAR